MVLSRERVKILRGSHSLKNSAIAVNVTIQEHRLLKNLVEQMSNRFYYMGYSLEKVPIGWNAIETSSIESYVNGDVNISNDTGMINMPFTSSFLFTCCTKGKRNDYDLTWSSSLS